MNWFTAVVLYIIIWWTALFAVLPVGVQPVAQPDELSGWRGAPATPSIWRKALWTTVVATAIWIICFGVIESGWISFRSGWLTLPRD